MAAASLLVEEPRDDPDCRSGRQECGRL